MSKFRTNICLIATTSNYLDACNFQVFGNFGIFSNLNQKWAQAHVFNFCLQKYFNFKGCTKKLFNGTNIFTTIYVRYLVHPVMSVTIDFDMSVNWCRSEYRNFIIIWTFIFFLLNENKGGLIFTDIFTLVPSSKICAKSLS